MPAGSDIVAWRHPRCANKSGNIRFLEKTCSPAEIQQIQQAENPDLLLWSFWALKEAAYKLSCFLGNRSGFVARRFETEWIPESKINTSSVVLNCMVKGVSMEDAVGGMAIGTGNDIFWGAVQATEKYIHAWAVPQPEQFSEIYWGVQSMAVGKKEESEFVRIFALQHLNRQFNNRFISIEKDADGIPYLQTANRANPYISISHDQGFLAFSFLHPTEQLFKQSP
jgi:phosphopantetheinyl transferase (holo-ACP synthase)